MRKIVATLLCCILLSLPASARADYVSSSDVSEAFGIIFLIFIGTGGALATIIVSDVYTGKALADGHRPHVAWLVTDYVLGTAALATGIGFFAGYGTSCYPQYGCTQPMLLPVGILGVAIGAGTLALAIVANTRPKYIPMISPAMWRDAHGGQAIGATISLADF